MANLTHRESFRLTYCTNIHAGESWTDVVCNLDEHALAVRNQFDPDTPFPLGLRISGQAASELNGTAISEFRSWCQQHNCYLLTINGFPYGIFHDQRVKEQVYLPDWRSQERTDYSKFLGDLAIQLQPDARRISISTVPIAFKPGFRPEDWPAVYQHIREVATHYRDLHKRTGIRLILSIEPEPLCVLETIAEVIDFFDQLKLDDSLRDYVGLCFDCCHQAVQFENAGECLEKIRYHQIPIGKVQVSSALKVNSGGFPRLLGFDEPVYLHQAVAREVGSNNLKRFVDLPDFTKALNSGDEFEECRVHFHVPVFLEHLGDCGTTQDFLRDFLPMLDIDTPLEVETYSFSVLPEHFRSNSVAQNIARELFWVRDLLKI